MQTVVSIDVDYFVKPKVVDARSCDGRPNDIDHVVRSIDYVDEFLKQRCLLSPDKRVVGRAAIDHISAFFALHDWIRQGLLKPPFKLVHIDAHADLGYGDSGYTEILEDILLRPPEDRASDLKELSLGNWLAYAIAARWIAEVIFLREPDPGRDPELLSVYFTASDNFSELLMKPMVESQYYRAMEFQKRHEFASLPTEERAVPWHQLAEVDFTLTKPPDFVFTCMSPQYAPPMCDTLFALIRKMIKEDDELSSDEIAKHLSALEQNT